MTGPITLIHCKDAMKIDTTKLPRVVDTPGPSSTKTFFNIAAKLPQESFEVTKNVVFGFTDEQLAHKCLADAPTSFVIRCETVQSNFKDTAE